MGLTPSQVIATYAEIVNRIIREHAAIKPTYDDIRTSGDRHSIRSHRVGISSALVALNANSILRDMKPAR